MANRRAALAVAVLFSAVTSCGADATKPLDADSSRAIDVPTAPAPLSAGACIDSTLSLDQSTIPVMIDALATTVENWIPSAPDDSSTGMDAIPGIDLRVRKVLGESSLGFSGEVAHVALPSVPGVTRAPNVTADDFLAAAAAHDEQIDAAAMAVAQAAPLAKSGAEQIRKADWSSPDGSEIFGCVEQLASTSAGAHERYFVLFSDLDQNRPPQVGTADLSGVHLLVVHVGNDVAAKRARHDAALDLWQTQGASAVEFVAPEQLTEMVPRWLRTGRSAE